MRKHLIMITEPIWNYSLKLFEVRWKYEGKKERNEIKFFTLKYQANDFIQKMVTNNE